jgi:hypothetical protein
MSPAPPPQAPERGAAVALAIWPATLPVAGFCRELRMLFPAVTFY